MKRFVLLPLLLLAACGSARQHTTRLLDHRLQASLAPDISAGRAILQPLPDGARVTLLTPALFANSSSALDDHYPDLRASVIEALLDPSLMRVQVTDTSALPPDQRDFRVSNVQRYFADNGLADVLRPSTPRQATPPGLNITINVHCPPSNHLIGYGDGKSHPVCE